VPVPTAALALSSLVRVDYCDAFLVKACTARSRPAESWARAVLEDAPPALRSTLIIGWLTLGLKRSPAGPNASVLGWEIRVRTSNVVLLGRDSHIGMPAELLFERDGDDLLFATFVQQDNSVARAIWAATEPRHVPAVRNLLERARRRLGDEG
jgi:hypothetical protein